MHHSRPLKQREDQSQTKATVKTNKETIELLLLIKKEKTAPLLGFDWMQRLKIKLSSNNDAIKIHYVKLDNTEKRIINLQNDFKDIFYNKQKDEKISVILNLKAGGQIIQQKVRPIPIHGTRTETTIKTQISGKSNRNYRRLLCKPCNNNGEKIHRRRLLLTPQN